MPTLITPPHRRSASFFVTTSKNLLMYWWAHLVILPVYVVCIAIVFQSLAETISSVLTISPLIESIGIPAVFRGLMRAVAARPMESIPVVIFAARVAILILGVLPALLPLFAPAYWRLGFRDRELLVITSCFVMIVLCGVYLFKQGHFDEVIAIVDANTLLLVLVAYIYLNRIRARQWVWFVAGAVGLAMLALAIMIFNPLDTGKYILFGVWGLLAFLASFYSVWRLIGRLRSDRVLPKPSKQYFIGYFFFYITMLVMYIVVSIVYNDNLLVIASVSLIALFTGAYPKFLFNRHVAYWREFTRPRRADRIADVASPFSGANHRWNWVVTRWMPKYLTLDNSRLALVLCGVVGGIVIPIGYVLNVRHYQQQLITSFLDLGGEYIMPSFLDLMLLGVVSTLVLMFSYSVIWLVRNRSNYLVTRINAPERLKTIANLTTQHLVAEFKQIARLLRLRQVENENLDRDAYNAFFVTSGVDHEFLGQLRETVSIDAANSFGAALGRIIAFFLQVFATLRLEVTAQQLDDGRIELAVTLGYRRSQTTTFKHIVLPENSLAQADEIFMRPIARGLALDLLVSSGQVAHLGSTQITLDYFLRGLDASSKRNWWQAISYYRQALETEKPERGTYSIGHYHLGAALIFQGNTEGLDHLYTAEVDGPPIPETQYMLALMLAHQHWDKLETLPNVFEEVVRRCHTALRLRREFPEAHQLLGSIYYHIARGKERRMTQVKPTEGKPQKKDDQSYYTEYQLAYRHFRIALRQHARAQRRMTASITQFRQYQEEEIAEIQRQMTITHQIGDALRGLKRFVEADSYYRDMMTIYPHNIRTLADLSKTYCLSQNWQRAEEFMWQIALNHDIGYWDADVAIHVGWGILGGITDTANTGMMDQTVRRLFVINRDAHSDRNLLYQVSQAFQHIDYALHQRPRYIDYWRQTNWVDPFKDVLEILYRGHKFQNFNWDSFFTVRFEFKPFLSEHRHISPSVEPSYKAWAVRWLTWIALRIYASNRDIGAAESIFKLNDLKQPLLEEFKQVVMRDRSSELTQANYPIVWRVFEQLHGYRQRIAKLIENSANNKRYIRELNDYLRLEIAKSLYEEWKTLDDELSKVISSEKQPSFLERWAVDVYAETALLSARMLAESGAVEHLCHLTDTACTQMRKWQMRWREIYKTGQTSDEKYATFTARVFDYQHVTLRAWKTYAIYELYFNPLVAARVKADVLAHLVPKSYRDQGRTAILDSIQADLDWTRKIIHYHPLVMYMQARLYRRRELTSQSIEEYERLLDLISPYDPKRHLSEGSLKRDVPEFNEQYRGIDAQSKAEARERLRYMEQISGRQQFSYFIDRARIHVEIASAYERRGDLQEAIQHLLEALRWSPEAALDIENFLRMGSHLNNIERYRDAQAIVAAVRERIQQSGLVHLPQSTRRAVDILECVVLNRGGLYGRALEKAKSIAHEFDIKPLNELVTEYVGNVGRFTEVMKDSPDDKVKWDNLRSAQLIAQLRLAATIIQKDVSEYILPEDELLFADKIAEQIQKIIQKIRDYDYPAVTFPRVFRRIIQGNSTDTRQPADPIDVSPLINPIANLARYSLDVTSLVTLLTRFKDSGSFSDQYVEAISMYSSIRSDFAKILLSQIIWRLSAEGEQNLIQIAELCNTLAFARAQMGLHIQHAYVDSTSAIVMMDYLLKLAPKTGESYQRFQREIAQYYDTMGWVYFRDTLPRSELWISAGERYQKQLHKAETNLRHGARYDQRRAIIHYHLAEVYHSRLAFRLQSIMTRAAFQRDFEAQQFLEKANEHLGHARRYDQFRRLHGVISSLSSRLAVYQPGSTAHNQLFMVTGTDKDDLPRPE